MKYQMQGRFLVTGASEEACEDAMRAIDRLGRRLRRKGVSLDVAVHLSEAVDAE